MKSILKFSFHLPKFLLCNRLSWSQSELLSMVHRGTCNYLLWSPIQITFLTLTNGVCGDAVGWGYKLEGCQFDSWWYHWNFSLTLSFWLYYGPWVDSASNRNEYQKCFLGDKGGWCIGLKFTIFMCQLSWNLGTSTSWNLQGLSRPVKGLLYLFTLTNNM